MNTLIQFLTDPIHVHLIDAKHVLRYLKGTMDYGLKYDANQKINLHDYVDSNWVGSTIENKSTLGWCFSLGSGMISCFSRKQSCVVLSAAEEEYFSTCSASCEVVWFQNLLYDLLDLTYILYGVERRSEALVCGNG